MDQLLKIGNYVGIALIIGIPLYLILAGALGFKYRKKLFGTRRIPEKVQSVPLEGNLFPLYFILENKGRVFLNSIQSETTCAFLLHWILDRKVVLRQNFVHQTTTGFNFEKEAKFRNKLENRIYQIFREASGEDLMLEADEANRWAYFHADQLFSIKDVEKEGKQWIEDHDFIEKENLVLPTLNKKGQQEARKVIALMNYLDALARGKVQEMPEDGNLGYYLILSVMTKKAPQFLTALRDRCPEKLDVLAAAMGTTSDRLDETVLDCFQICDSLWKGDYDDPDAPEPDIN